VQRKNAAKILDSSSNQKLNRSLMVPNSAPLDCKYFASLFARAAEKQVLVGAPTPLLRCITYAIRRLASCKSWV